KHYFQINLQEKRVSVTTTLPVEEIHAELKKSGKTVTLLSSTKQELFGQTETDANKTTATTTAPSAQPKQSRAQGRRATKFRNLLNMKSATIKHTIVN
ncbi:unnamed protein product, partial [Allacma fusca]